MPAPDPFRVFDPAAHRRHRSRAAAAAGAGDFLFAASADRLAETLGEIKRRFPRVLDLGSRGGLLGERLKGIGGIEHVVDADPASAFAPAVTIDAEALPFAAGSFDLVLSNLLLHWANDLPGALLQIRHALKPDGLFLGALFGGETLTELREAWIAAEADIENGASPRISPFADARDLAGLLQRAGFALPVVDNDRIDVTYADALALMRDLRLMGETNATRERRRSFTRRATLMRMAEIYRERFADADGRIHARFEIVTLTAWAPHESQPKPLRPGSAEARLAHALDTEEHGTGDKPKP
jgi:SAM-dependent methyltransferase